ncbi:MAG: DUF1772 domain-containing protein [Formosimonas sp.]|jgi:uncharacterized membrane protein
MGQKLSKTLHGLAVIGFGVMAGFFWTYSANVNLAMLEMDGATYATVQSAFNRNVRHALFFAFFFGPPVVVLAALSSARQQWKRFWFVLLAFAGVLYALGVIVFTAKVNLPLNYYTESWNPAQLPEDWVQIRDQWNAANIWRCVMSGLAFGISVLTLGLRGSKH